MARERVSVDDLRFAAEWLDAYNDGEDTDFTGNNEVEPYVAVARRVAEWLRKEAESREVAAEVHELLKAAGVTTADAKTKAKARRIVQARRANAREEWS